MLHNIIQVLVYFANFFVMIGMNISKFISHIFPFITNYSFILIIIGISMVFIYWGVVKLILRKIESTWRTPLTISLFFSIALSKSNYTAIDSLFQSDLKAIIGGSILILTLTFVVDMFE